MIPKLDKLEVSKHWHRLVWTALALQILIGSAIPVYSAEQLNPDMDWISKPSYTTAQYEYVMTARVRLLFFWAGADDVGGGYIRRATASSGDAVQLIQVLFGSDPARAPRKINHWGSAVEAIGEQSTAFFGFMKSANTGSARDAEAEIQRQKANGRHGFEAIVSAIDSNRAVSRVIPLFSDTDFNLHQLDEAQRLIVNRLHDSRHLRQLAITDEKCKRRRGFLQAIDELTARSLSENAAHSSLCYVYNARIYTLTLDRQTAVSEKNIRIKRKNGSTMERTYRDLLHLKFETIKQESKGRTSFDLIVGTKGELRGVPVQIVHQPNWWFQVVLNLLGH